MQLTPTVVVGVGQAGINVINRLHDSDGLGWGSESDEYFDYVAIDSSPEEVRNAPDKATQVSLQSPRRDVETDKRAYPYLTADIDITERGARRQRPVGRYKLDSGDSHEETVEAITHTVEGWAETVRTSSDLPLELNIVHVHSLGGGTGSGTIPLVTSIIDEIVAEVQSEYGIAAYTAGIGIVPETLQYLDSLNPQGDDRYYAHTYAALRDLKHLIDASPEDPLPLSLYLAFEEAGDGNLSDVDPPRPQRQLTKSPYQDYFLVSVDEDRMVHDDLGPEPYRDTANNIITAAIYGIGAKWGSRRLSVTFGMGIQRGFRETRIGSFDQTQVSVPIQSVRTCCDLNERIENLREQVGRNDGDGTLVGRLRDKQRQRAVLERCVRDPVATLRERTQPVAVAEEIETALDRTIGSEEAPVKPTPDGIDQLIDSLDEHHDAPILLLALQRASERLKTAEQRRETALLEQVDAEWDRIGDTESIDSGAHAVLERADVLREYLRGEVERLERKLDADRRWFLPSVDILSLNPDHEQQRGDYRQRLAELEERRAALEAVWETRRAVQTRREQLLETRIEPELDRLTEQIGERRAALERKNNDLDELLAEREETLNELTDAEFGDRIARLALDEELLREDLDRETLEEDLTSLSAFHQEGYLADDIEDLFKERIGQSHAWDSTLLSWAAEVECEFGAKPGGIRDIWMLHSDENTSLPGMVPTGTGQHRFLRSDNDGAFPTFEDPYTVQFLSYTLDFPLTDLQLYSELVRAADEGWFDTIIDLWDDYRLAFAYPEWYGREITTELDETPTVLPRLPEPDETKVTIPEQSGEFEDWSNSHALASYLWLADEWDDFSGSITVDGHDPVGWKHYLRESYGLTYDDIREAVSRGGAAELWNGDEITWEDLLKDVIKNLITKHGVEVTLTGD